MKKFLAFIATVMCVMLFATGAANAAEPAIETTVTPQIAAAQSQTVIVVIETNDAIIIVIIQ